VEEEDSWVAKAYLWWVIYASKSRRSC